MELINQFLRNLSQPIAMDIYYLFRVAGFVVHVPLLIFVSGKMGLRKWKNVSMFSGCVLLSTFTILTAVGVENSHFMPSSGNGIIMYVFLGIAYGKIMGISATAWLTSYLQLYLYARSAIIIGCIFPGCCHGVRVDWGLYSMKAGCTVFPCNLMEAVLSVVIASAAMYYARKSNYSGNGKIGGYVLISYGILRFISDLIRANIKIVAQTSFDGIVALGIVLIGLLIIYFIDNPKKREPKHISI